MTIAVLASVAGAAERWVRSAGYGGLVAVMVIENVFPPIPSEIVLPFAGFEVSRGQMTFIGALLAATVGSVVGAWILYTIGRRGGRPLVLRLHPLLRIGDDDLARTERWFARRGDWIVLLARIVPGLRSVVSIPAGMLCMPLWRFSLLTAVGSLVWNAALIAAGQALGSKWTDIGGVVGPISTVVLAGASIAAAGWFIYWRRLRTARETT